VTDIGVTTLQNRLHHSLLAAMDRSVSSCLLLLVLVSLVQLIAGGAQRRVNIESSLAGSTGAKPEGELIHVRRGAVEVPVNSERRGTVDIETLATAGRSGVEKTSDAQLAELLRELRDLEFKLQAREYASVNIASEDKKQEETPEVKEEIALEELEEVDKAAEDRESAPAEVDKAEASEVEVAAAEDRNNVVVVYHDQSNQGGRSNRTMSGSDGNNVVVVYHDQSGSNTPPSNHTKNSTKPRTEEAVDEVKVEEKTDTLTDELADMAQASEKEDVAGAVAGSQEGFSKLLGMLKEARSKLNDLETEINNQNPYSSKDLKKRRKKRHN